MSDHKSKAEGKLAGIGARFSQTYEEMAAQAAIAQVHATLYLAEQQRIANLIALANRDQDAIGKDLDGLRMGTAGEVWEALGIA